MLYDRYIIYLNVISSLQTVFIIPSENGCNRSNYYAIVTEPKVTGFGTTT